MKKNNNQDSLFKEGKLKEVSKIKEVIYFDMLSKKALNEAVSSNSSVLLVGETGTGKTAFIRELAKKRNTELIRLNLTGQTGVDEILGKWLANSNGMYWVDGLLIKAMKEGHWIVFDEINMALPEILSALHALLDDDRKIVLKEKDGEIIRPHENFRFFATMNPCDEYVGTKELNKAFLSRFSMILNVEYSKKEADILVDRTGIKKDDADKIVTIANTIRELKEKNEINYVCSTRDLIYFSKLIMNGFKINEAFNLSILNKVETREEKTAVEKIGEYVTGEKMSVKIPLSEKQEVFSSFSKIKEKFDELENSVSEMVMQRDKYKDMLREIGEEKQALMERYDKFKSEKLEKVEKLEKELEKIKENIQLKVQSEIAMLKVDGEKDKEKLKNEKSKRRKIQRIIDKLIDEGMSKEELIKRYKKIK